MTRQAAGEGTANSLQRQVQWYPGHMVRTTRKIREYLRLVDIVIEVVDARIAHSGRYPGLDSLAGPRTRVVALDRDDLAESAVTKRWMELLSHNGAVPVAVDGRSQRSVGRLASAIAAARPNGVSRAMIVGLPNSGKSSIVNALLRRSAARTENRAGVTRQLQWFRLSPNVEIMDTPGVLPPKIRAGGPQWKLALCGAVPSTRYDPVEIATAFYQWLISRKPNTAVPDLQAFAAKRGFVRRGGDLDYHNAGHSYIRAFNDGVFGRISLEVPDDAEAA